MKTMKLKTVITTAVAILIASMVFASGDMKAIMENIKAKQQVVSADLVKVNHEQARVKTLGKECREQRTSAAHKAYMDAKADLMRSRKQLKADDKNLMQAHQEHIKAHKQELREEEKVLVKAQRTLDRDHAKGRVATLTDADRLMDARAEMRNRFTALERARLERDKDRWVVDREYFDAGAKSNMQLSSAAENNTILRVEK